MMTMDIPLPDEHPGSIVGKRDQKQEAGPNANRIVRAGNYGRVNTLKDTEHMKV